MNVLVILFIILTGVERTMATSCGIVEDVDDCRLQEKGIFVAFSNKKLEVTTEKVSTGVLDNVEVREIVFDEKIKCRYDFKNLSGVNPDAILKMYSNICVDVKNDFNFIFNSGTRCRSMPISVANSDGTVKIVQTKRSPLGYIWQVGECSRNSKEYFNKLKQVFTTTTKKLLKNKFLLVSEDDKSLTYYANPGYVVVLEKNEKLCKKNKNCELNIILKKRLSSAILDADGKLHTDEPF